MGVRLFTVLVAASTVLAAVSLGIVVTTIDPFAAGAAGFVAFYISLLLTLVGLLFIAGSGVRLRLAGRQSSADRVRNALRQSILLTLLVLGWTMLQAAELARWWVMLLLVGIVSLLEFFFMTRQGTGAYAGRD